MPFAARSWWPVAVLRALAFVAAFCCAGAGALLALSLRQGTTADPLRAPALLEVVKRAETTPANTNLFEQARAMDLLARRVFFANPAFARQGAWLLPAGMVLLVGALRASALARRAITGRGESPSEEAAVRAAQPVRRAAVAYGAIALAGTGLLLTLLRDRRALAAMPSAGEAGAEAVPTAAAGATGAPPAAASSADVASAAEMAANWPAFRGYRGLGGSATNGYPTKWDGASGEGVLWKKEVPLPGPNSPIVWNDRIFLTGASDTTREIFCFDAGSGELRWRHAATNIPGSPAKPPQVADDTGLCASTMATDGRRVFAIFATGDLVACDLEGKRAWAQNLGVPHNPYGYASSLMADGDRLFVQYDQEKEARVMAFDVATGREAWSIRRDVKPSWASPIVAEAAGKPLLVTFGNPALIAYDPADGRHVWRVDGFEAEVSVSPAVADGRVFAGNEYARLVAAGLADGKVQWELEENLPEVSAPLAAHGLLFLATSSGLVACYDAATGARCWEHEFDAGFLSSPLAAGGRVYLSDEKGVTHIFKAARTFEAVADNALGEEVFATPAFAGGRIYLRGKKHLFAIGERAKEATGP